MTKKRGNPNWVKGVSGNPSGLSKEGAIDKKRFKRGIEYLLEQNSDNMIAWLERIAEDDPKGAFKVITDLAEFVTPKMSRQEHTGIDGEALTISGILQAIQTPVLPNNSDIEAIETTYNKVCDSIKDEENRIPEA